MQIDKYVYLFFLIYTLNIIEPLLTQYIYHNNRDADEYREIFNTNVVGTSNVTQALLPLLRKGNTRRIINITSNFGSITLIPPGVSTPSVCMKMYNLL